MKTFSRLVFFLVTLLFVGCEYLQLPFTKPTEPPLARVGEKYLYLSDIQRQFPDDLSETDSIVWVKNRVNSWVQQQLMLDQAEKNLTAEQRDFSQQLEDYRKSLLIHHYENRWLEQALNTEVSNEEIQAYYEAHQENYKLNRNVVKALFFTVSVRSEKTLKEVKKIFVEREIDFQKIDVLCAQNRISDCNLDTTHWIYFDNLQQVVPIETYNEEAFLRSNKRVQFGDGDRYYFLCIYDYLLTKELSPLDLEADNISKIILNRRKKELISDLHSQIYHYAEQSGFIEFFNETTEN